VGQLVFCSYRLSVCWDEFMSIIDGLVSRLQSYVLNSKSGEFLFFRNSPSWSILKLPCRMATSVCSVQLCCHICSLTVCGLHSGMHVVILRRLNVNGSHEINEKICQFGDRNNLEAQTCSIQACMYLLCCSLQCVDRYRGKPQGRSSSI
jgi:hypothetical protein